MKARWAFLAALLIYVVWLIFGYRYHFLDGINLALHEAGHIFFTPFGKTAHFLGGTIGQLIFPALFVGYFWRRDQRFESFVVAVWFAESLMYGAHYIADARRMELPLVGGGIHDWNWLLSRWGMLDQAEGLGTFIHVVASFIAIAALTLAARELWLQSTRAQREAVERRIVRRKVRSGGSQLTDSVR